MASGFLMAEFIVVFALISLAIVLFAQTFYGNINEYKHAKQRIEALHILINQVECNGADIPDTEKLTHEYTSKSATLPINFHIPLPHIPTSMQTIISIHWQDKNKTKKLSVCSGVTSL